MLSFGLCDQTDLDMLSDSFCPKVITLTGVYCNEFYFVKLKFVHSPFLIVKLVMSLSVDLVLNVITDNVINYLM